MADGSYPYQQRAGQQYYYPQPGHSTHHQRPTQRSTGSPVNSGRTPFAADTPSPSRSPTPQSPANLYSLYNSQGHQQQSHSVIMNGNQNAQRFPMQMGLGSKYPQQQQQQQQQHHPHAQHVGQHHHQQQQQQPQQHQDHSVHGGASNHQHTYSSGGLSNATPHFTPNTIQNGGQTNGHGGMGKPVSEFWSHQLQLAAESRQGSSPHHNARTNVNVNKILITSAPAQAQKDGETERHRPGDQSDEKKQDWVALDIGGQGLRSLAMAVFNYDFLTTLYLNHNRLTYIPPAIGRMRSLTHLDLSGNQLTELPPEIGMLVKLKSLLMFDNLLRGLPFELGSLYRLETLGIEGNPMSDEMRSELMQNGTASLINYLREQAPVTLPPSQRDWVLLNSSPESEEERFTTLNYNILCEKYATRSQYGYTPSHALSWEYRRELILNEIRDQNADIVCLQEIDAQSYHDYFRPNLAYNDYKGVFQTKSRARTMQEHEAKLVDGCATFYKNTKYIMLDKQIIDFANTAINRPDMKGEHDIFNRVMPKDNIAVVTFFENRLTGSRVIIVNVHVDWDPAFKDVKVVQVAIMLEQVAKYSDKYAKWPACTDKAAFRHSEPTIDGEEDNVPEPPPDPKPSLEYASGSAIPLVLCGDFNSMTDSGVYELLANSTLSSSHSDLSGRAYGKFTRDGISHPFMLKSAYANIGELSFTNYTPDFTAVIDYIWYSTNALEAVGLLGELDQEYLQRVPGFPHYHFPSDHLPLLAQFSIKPQTKSKPITRPDFGPQRDRR